MSGRKALRRRLTAIVLMASFSLQSLSLPRVVLAHGGGSPAPPSFPPPCPMCPSGQCCAPCGSDNPQSMAGGPGDPYGGPSTNATTPGTGGSGGPGTSGPGHYLYATAASTIAPVLLRYGISYEQATDFTLPAPAFGWNLTRSYASNTIGLTAGGAGWLMGVADAYLLQSGTNIVFLLNAASQRTFVYNSSTSTYTGPTDSYLQLVHDTTNKRFLLTDLSNNVWFSFNDFTVTPTAVQGKMIEQSTLQWHAQGHSGYQYSYNTNGTINQITTPTGQDYTIHFTYNPTGYIYGVTVKNTAGTQLAQIAYVYYQDITSPSSDIGTAGDLVAMTSNIAVGSSTFNQWTMYRYDSSHHLKAIYDNDAVERICAADGISSPITITQEPDTYGSPNPPIKDYATKSFTYYGTSPPSTNSVSTPFTANENLSTEYGGTNAIAANMVATETVGGCGGCGTANSVTKSYYYMSLANSTSDQNQVVSLVVEDTQDSAGNAIYRTVYAFENSGRLLRKAFIQNPSTSPSYWCESWKFATATGSTALAYRLGEYRLPSAHTGVTTAASLRTFLNPYNGTSWANDTSTLNSSSGMICVYTYNSAGMLTASQVKDGSGGTAYYIGAADYGDSINTTLVTATYDYPTETTTRSNGKQTGYSYTFYDSSTHQQIETRTTTLPTISTSENGSGVATTMAEYYDNLGRLRWTQNGEGYINYTSYNPVTGGIAYQAIDVNPASPGSDITSGSTGNWDSISVGGASSNEPTRGSSLPTALLLPTKTYYDGLGRPIQVTDSGGNNHYVVYTPTQTIVFPYWNSSSSQCAVPIQMTNLMNTGGVANVVSHISDEIRVRANYTAISTSSGAPTGFSTAPSQSDYVAWTHYTYDPTNGRLTYTDRYIDSPSSGAGTLSTDFYRTVTQYDTLSRKQYDIQVIRGSVHGNRVEQVTQYVYDVRDRIIQINKGVSGDLAANSQDMTDSYNVYPTLYPISQAVYDSGGVGDGYITKTRHFFGTGTSNYTGANVYRTYRGHIRGFEPFYVSGTTETPIGPYTVQDVDWKGRPTTTARYSADPTWSSVLASDGYPAYASSTSTNRLTETSTLYDDLGRVYQLLQYDIVPSSGTGTNYLEENTFYDRNDRVVASAPAYAAGTEMAYDGAGRKYEDRTVTALQSTPYSSGAYQYCAPAPNSTLSSMTGGDAGVLVLSHQSLDVNGNVLETDTFEDNHDDITGSTPGINLTNNNDYVRRTVFNWFDVANRRTTTADYGSGDSSTGAGQWKYAAIPSRPSSAPTASTSTGLVTLYSYTSDSGFLQTVTDPAGTVTKNFYDNLGRKTYLAQNWQNFIPPSTGTGNPNDRVTQYVYDGPTRVQQLVAMDPNGTGTLTNNQVTTYLYEDPVDATRNTSQIYPDSTDTTSSGTNQIKLAYNVDGALAQRTDQRGVVLSYAYTNNRLLSTESATTVPSGVDGTVLSIAHTYDNLNRPQNVTSYASTGGTGTVVNDVQYAYYNGTANPVTSYQEHKGAVSTSTSLNVQYTYDTTTTGSIYSNQLRLQTEVHPNGRAIYYDYGSSGSTAAYNATSTVREIWDGSPSGTGLAVYDYNGAGTRLAIATYLQPSFKLDHFEGASGTYAALDRFGRVVDQYWAGFSGTSDVDRTHYAYDYVGRRVYRQIDTTIYPTDNLDQAYTYDALSRLLTSQVGTLSGTTISGTPASEEDWTLDGLGNWAGYVQKNTGTAILNQSRTASPANEISGISASVGSTWLTPAYDLAGNMTTIPIPSSPTSGYTAIYDAWNRLVSLANGTTTVATYAYDGLSRRIVKGIYVSGSLDHNEHTYLNNNWQALEVRKELSGTIIANPLEQYVWHPFYLDALALRDYDSTTSGSPTRYYYTFDANYRVTAATTAGAALAERYYYSPYGTLLFLNSSFTPLATQASQIGNSVTFTGRQFDPESGLYYFRQRFLHAQLGLFIARDPCGMSAGDNNLYRYALSAPTNFLDPFGEAIIIDTKASRQSTFKDLMLQRGFARDIMLGLQDIIGDCATLSVNVTSQIGVDGTNITRTATLTYSNEKQPCKNNETWQDIKKAIDAKKTYKIIWDPDTTNAAGDPQTGEVSINNALQASNWEIDPAGGAVYALTPFNVALYHELIGHAVEKNYHESSSRNTMSPTNNSSYYDPAIKCENKARRALGLPQRVWKYYDDQNSLQKWWNPHKPGDTLPYNNSP
jgi:RHS repeat-associated protein